MSVAIDKTKQLGRVMLPITALIPNENNPNEMSDAEFNMLSDNIEQTGITDPILVRKLGEGQYRIIGGHHRWEVAKVLGFEEIPCTVIDDPAFDDDMETFQVVRMNVIRGRMSPEKFFNMYSSLAKKHGEAIMQESFGFADEDEFRKLLTEVKKSLPKELQKDFSKAVAELKTIDGLSKVLNSLFTKYGSTLPYGYMYFDYGGKDSIWLRMSGDTKKAIDAVGKLCVEQKRTVDDILGGLIVKLAKGDLHSHVLQLIAETDEVEIPEDVTLPSKEILGVQ